MGDIKTEIIDSAKVLLEIDDDTQDDKLMLLTDEAIDAVLSYCRLEVLPTQLVSLIPVIVAGLYRGNIADGIKAVTEGERKIEYSEGSYDYLKKYEERLKPFVSRKVKLPSDLECDAP